MFCVCVFTERIKRGDNFAAPSLALYPVEAFRRLFLVSFPNSGIIRINLVTEKVDTLGYRVYSFVWLHLQPYGFHPLMNEAADFPKSGLIGSHRSLVVAIAVIIFQSVFRLKSGRGQPITEGFRNVANSVARYSTP